MPKLPTYRFEIPEAALGAYVFASDDDNRHNIANICIRYTRGQLVKEKTIHATTTDGHRLLHLDWVAEPKDRVFEGDILIPKTVAKELLAVIKTELTARAKEAAEAKQKFDRTVRYWVQSGKKWSITSSLGINAEFEQDESHVFPDWAHVIPRQRYEKDTGAPVHIGLNYNYVASFQKYMQKYGDRVGGMKFSLPQDDLSPILVTPVQTEEGRPHIEFYLGDGVTRAEAVLMPMRT